MVSIEKITADMFPKVFDRFLEDDDEQLGRDDWRPLFGHQWDDTPGYYGYALFDDDRVVGMLGMLFSNRWIGGRWQQFCNLHSWFVDEQYRGYSLMLMRPALQLTDCTLTDLSPTEHVCSIARRLGFREMDSHLKILLPATRLRAGGRPRLDFMPDGDLQEGIADPPVKRLIEHHLALNCGELTCREDDEICHVIYSRVVRHWMPYCYIHYVSNKELFARRSVEIRRRLLKESRTRYAAIDRRQLPGVKLPFSFDLPLAVKQLYRTRQVAPQDIDSLYSEVALLNLTTFPDLSHWLRRRLSRARPGTTGALPQSATTGNTTARQTAESVT